MIRDLPHRWVWCLDENKEVAKIGKYQYNLTSRVFFVKTYQKYLSSSLQLGNREIKADEVYIDLLDGG
jgi:hypothetical protein